MNNNYAIFSHTPLPTVVRKLENLDSSLLYFAYIFDFSTLISQTTSHHGIVPLILNVNVIFRGFWLLWTSGYHWSPSRYGSGITLHFPKMLSHAHLAVPWPADGVKTASLTFEPSS